MEELITHLGIPAIVVILILREIIPALKGGGNVKNVNGNLKRAEFEKFTEKVQYKSTCDEIVKRMDVRFDNVDRSLTEVKTLIKNGNQK